MDVINFESEQNMTNTCIQTFSVDFRTNNFNPSLIKSRKIKLIIPLYQGHSVVGNLPGEPLEQLPGVLGLHEVGGEDELLPLIYLLLHHTSAYRSSHI